MPIMSAENLLALQSELTNDPESLGYAGKGALEVARLMNASTGDPTHSRISLDDIMDWLVENGKYRAIKVSSEIEAERFMMVAGEPHIATLNPANPQVQTLFTDLRDAGFLVNADLTALRALAEQAPIGPSRAETLFGWVIYPENIIQAREGM